MGRWGWMAIIGCVGASAASALPLEGYQHDRALARMAHHLAEEAVTTYLETGHVSPVPQHGLDPRLLKPGGAFVTVVKDGNTRGCWGSVYPQTPTLAQEIREAAIKALRDDYRHHPVTRSELRSLQVYVSLVGPLEPVEDPGGVSPRHDGLLVTARGHGGVLLPGEARTSQWMIAACRRKAGLSPHESAQMFRFPTVVYGPEGESK